MLWQIGVAVLIGWLAGQLGFRRAVRRLAERVQRARKEGGAAAAGFPGGGALKPVREELTQLWKELRESRSAAEEEARLRLAGEARWTPERLKLHVRSVLRGRPFLVIANREPYTHIREAGRVKCVTPASGLVTAVEPVLRACGGTWVASASGDADRETADERGRLRVPPDAPVYTLRRVWLTEQEEEGYYYGFANEGLWPLCHIAYTRPVFRVEDWEQYKRVNERFARAAAEEMDQTQNPFVLVQDYHFALLPKFLRALRPDAKIALFWHIPWPNPETFGICPWGRELLAGMLGADLLGFHIQFHCNNFLDTADRLLESRIDWEQFAVNRSGHRSVVKPFPIGIAPAKELGADGAWAVGAGGQAREKAVKELGMPVKFLGVGVDRVDYTKGIPERFRAIERLMEKHPELRGSFTFVELAAPSRTLIKRYSDLGSELHGEAERINKRFQSGHWRPIVLRMEHHSHEAINLFYRAADLCLVTSLHDGMNLVGKEFVGSRGDERGVLVLSRFAGASRELRDALLVNPYDVDEVSEAIHRALTMPADEQRLRMVRMRAILEERNVYRWAADITTELDRIRPDG